MAKKDYYDILGVKKTDSSETIKKSYKKLAIKFHPDKAGDDKKQEYENHFKAINEAYSTLGDDEKRAVYDRGGSSSSGQNSGFRGGGNFSDIFSNLFGSGFSGDEDLEDDVNLSYELVIEFHEAAFGCEKEVVITKNIFCSFCGGTGSENRELERCKECNGQGRMKLNQRTSFGVISQVVMCHQCYGQGETPKIKCKKCSGKGIVASKEHVKIKIPQGIDNGQTLRIKSDGNVSRNGFKGDLFLLIRVKPHKVFTRKGFDVFMDTSINFSQAALGGNISVPTISGEDIKIKIEKGIVSGSVLRIRKKGIPFINDAENRGDQFVQVKIRTPQKLNKSQIKLFEELAKLEE
ncbi:MAG TPA: DnaJ C-terminal domain-containing protein [Candidatus Nanoarchaeia archaeon]|nr:DnaJ C-terminal domain-containing protein [Candidatus Nanoarchaeia archaeon]